MELIEYGKIIKIHGIKGEIRVFPYSSDFHNFDYLARLFIGNFNCKETKEFTVESKRIHKRSIIVKLKDIDTPEMAGQLVGRPVFLDKDSLSTTDEDEYYWFDLIGLSVVTTEGVKAGTVEHLMETPAHDILIVKSGDNEYLVPVNDRFIKKIDIENSEIIIYPVEGLIE